ncbi:MAG TPA: glycosyltransferase family 2 protein [Ktedonobacteraceae bacterium]
MQSQIHLDPLDPPLSIDETAGHLPAAILEVELGQALPPLSAINEQTGYHYQRALCLVRLHTQPLGRIDLTLTDGQRSPLDYAPLIWDALGEQINAHLQQDGLAPVTVLDASGLPATSTPRCIVEYQQFLAHAPFVSVIIPTHNRPDRIQSCLRTLLALDYPDYEIIVVDNAPAGPETAEYIQQTYANQPRVRYVREDRVGGSWARNCGITAARGKILAFADDDIVVDSHWLAEIVKAFTLADNVVCVTSLLLPLELETPAQFLLEEFGGFNKGFQRRIFDMQEHHPKTQLYPYTAGQFGTGACMAFTSDFLQRVGGFDIALGPATIARGGEDLTLFFEAIVRGYKLIYEPAAIGYHPHHREYAALQKQIYSYGVGIAAFLARNVLRTPRLLFNFIAKLPYGLYFVLSSGSSKNSKKSSDYPKELTKLELKGMLYGPFAYVKSRWQVRHAH